MRVTIITAALGIRSFAGGSDSRARWEELLGAMCRSGFVIEDLIEPFHAEPQAAPGSFPHRSRYVPPYVRIKARRTGPLPANQSSGKLWTP